MSQYNKIVIIGATSAIAENCARLWLNNSPQEMILVGRDQSRLDPVAADLRVRGPATKITTLTTDFVDATKIATLARECAEGGAPDLVLVAHGYLPDQMACQADIRQCSEAISINGVSPVLFAEAFAGPMEAEGKGILAIVGSVAGDRGRKSNYVYGASKGLIETYVQGLQHRLASSDVRVVLIKPGPTDTPMTAHLKIKGVRLASIEGVASTIVGSIAKKKSTIYVPFKWSLIMLVIRNLPNGIFGKMNI